VFSDRCQISEVNWCVITLQVFCTVLNSSYDVSVCSCDEQMSVFDTCVSQYPCLRVYVSYNITASTTPSQPHPPSSSQNSSSLPASGDRRHDRRRSRRRSAAASTQAPVVNQSATSTGGLSDVLLGLPAEVADSREHRDGVETQQSSLNVSLDNNYVLAVVSSASSRDNDSNTATTKYQHSPEQLSENGSASVTSYRIANDTRQIVTGYDFTPTTSADVNHYVAQLYRSWDDSFLPQVFNCSHFIYYIYYLSCMSQE